MILYHIFQRHVPAVHPGELIKQKAFLLIPLITLSIACSTKFEFREDRRNRIEKKEKKYEILRYVEIEIKRRKFSRKKSAFSSKKLNWNSFKKLSIR